MTIGFGDLHKGATIELDGQPYEVIDYERQKMQQRAPVTRLKLRNLRDGRVMQRTFQSYTTEFTVAQVDTRETQYLYNDGDFYHFMDMENYEQYQLTKEQIAENTNYLTDGISLEMVFYKENPITLRLPTFVELTVNETPPGYKGDTAQGGTKPATLETGLTVQVPMFITAGERLKIDTRNGKYIERVT